MTAVIQPAIVCTLTTNQKGENMKLRELELHITKMALVVVLTNASISAATLLALVLLGGK